MIAAALFEVLRPSEMLSVTGSVYRTLEEVVGLRGHGKGNSMDFGVSYSDMDLKKGMVDFEGIAYKVTERTKVVFIQN